MTGEEQIKRILKGIADDGFQMLAKRPQTVADVTNLCQRYHKLRIHRALKRRSFGPDKSLSILVAGSDNNTLSTRIQYFIREEVARQLSLVSYTPMSDGSLALSLRSDIQQQLAVSIPRCCQHAPVDASLIGADIAQPTAAVPLTFVNFARTLPVAAPPNYADAVSRPFVESVSSSPIVQVMPRQYTDAA